MKKTILLIAMMLLLITCAAAEEAGQSDSFYITTITDELFARIYGKSFKEDCTLPREDLRYLHVLHKDLDGNEHEGEMIVNVHIAEDVLDILKQLYEADYPIEKIRLVDEIVEPITGEPYLDCSADFPYKIDENDLCYRLFMEKGFEWGGSWEDRKDYQHFEIPTEQIAVWYPENE